MNNSHQQLSQSFQSKLESFRDFLQDQGLDIDSSPLKTRIEFFVEGLKDWNLFMDMEELLNWYDDNVENPLLNVNKKPLNSLSDWKVDTDSGNISHQSGNFFKILGLEVQNAYHREVESSTWEQPIIEEDNSDAGLLGLLRKRFHGIPHYLIQAKEEPGNYNLCQLSPTLQATFSNLKKQHGGRTPHFTEFFYPDTSDEDVSVIRRNWVTEDGGRFLQKRNHAMLVELNNQKKLELPDRYQWFSLYQLRQLNQNFSIINPFIRTIISLV